MVTAVCIGAKMKTTSPRQSWDGIVEGEFCENFELRPRHLAAIYLSHHLPRRG